MQSLPAPFHTPCTCLQCGSITRKDRLLPPVTPYADRADLPKPDGRCTYCGANVAAPTAALVVTVYALVIEDDGATDVEVFTTPEAREEAIGEAMKTLHRHLGKPYTRTDHYQAYCDLNENDENGSFWVTCEEQQLQYFAFG